MNIFEAKKSESVFPRGISAAPAGWVQAVPFEVTSLLALTTPTPLPASPLPDGFVTISGFLPTSDR